MRARILFSAVCILLFSFPASSQTTGLLKSYGGSASDGLNGICLLPDSGYLLTGVTRLYHGSGTEACLIRTNQNGDTIWTKIIGTGIQVGYMSISTSDSSLISCISQSSPSTGTIAKTSLSGQLTWHKNLTAASSYATINFVSEDSAGYLFSGSIQPSTTDILYGKMDTAGNVLWSHSIGISQNWESGNFIRPCPSGGSVMAGVSYPSSFVNNTVLVRLDPAGDTVWTKVYSSPSGLNIGLDNLQVLPDGFLLTCFEGPVSTSDIVLIRTDMNGDTLWTRRYGGNGGDLATATILRNPKLWLLAGRTNSYSANGDNDILLICVDQNGSVLWNKVIGGTGNEEIRAGTELKNGFALAGTSTSFHSTSFNSDYDLLLLTVDTLGNFPCFSSSVALTVGHPAIQVGHLPFVIGTGASLSACSLPVAHGCSPVNWCGPLGTEEPVAAPDEISVYPQPSGGTIQIDAGESGPGGTIEIYSVDGRLMTSRYCESPVSQVSCAGWAPGIYLLLFRNSAGEIFSRKIIVN